MKIYVASAFSKNNSGGNKAGVCLIGEYLDNEKKNKISSELGYAETAFISDSMKKGALFKLEYFTPTEEVPLCGHATIAAFTVMKELNLLKRNEFNIETKSGILSILIKDNIIFMEQNRPRFFDEIESNVFKDCFDIEAVSDELKPQIVSTGLKDIMLPVKDIEILNNMKPNLDEIKRISKKYAVVGIHAFAAQRDRIVCRNFAPLYGVPEESASGTANCALACYLHKNNINIKQYIFEQGYSLNEPSEIIVNLETQNDYVEKVTVGGRGYLV